MNYKLNEEADITFSLMKEKRNKYKKINHSKSRETYSRKGKNKFSIRDIDY